MTLREAFDLHYDKSELASSTLKTYHCALLSWERYSDDPPIDQITNETVAAWRQKMLDTDYRPASINGFWRNLRAIFRRLGPQVTGCPHRLVSSITGGELRQARQAAGMTQRDVGKLLEVSAGYVSQMESGDTPIHADHAEKLRGILNLKETAA